jgi:hypothetical protein
MKPKMEVNVTTYGMKRKIRKGGKKCLKKMGEEKKL